MTDAFLFSETKPHGYRKLWLKYGDRQAGDIVAVMWSIG